MKSRATVYGAPRRRSGPALEVLGGLACVLRRVPAVLAAVAILTGSYNAYTPDYHCATTPAARIHSTTWQCR